MEKKLIAVHDSELTKEGGVAVYGLFTKEKYAKLYANWLKNNSIINLEKNEKLSDYMTQFIIDTPISIILCKQCQKVYDDCHCYEYIPE